MPDRPTWIPKIPAILEILEKPGAPPFLDRAAIETLFGLRRRQAIALMHRWDGYWIGQAFLAHRAAVIRFLRDPQRRTAYLDSEARGSRLATQLGEARQEREQRRIAIPALPDPDRIDFAGLPAGIHLQAQQLTVSFETPTQLLEKLLALSQAFMNDYDTFEAALAGPTPRRPE